MTRVGYTYEFDFAIDDENWILSNAQISGGVLDTTADYGSGKRIPDANWFSDTTDDFIIEIDFKQDSTPAGTTLHIYLKLIDDPNSLYFWIKGDTHLMQIRYDGEIKVSQAFVDNTNWHTAKIRRAGTVYYFSIDGGSEISWNHGTERAVQHVMFSMNDCTGEFDNFKYSWMQIVINEVENIGETKNKLRALLRIENEILNINELQNKLRTLARIVSETVNIPEAKNYVRARFKVVNEVINMGELKNYIRGRYKVISEAINIGELQNKWRALLRIANEVVNMGEVQNYTRGRFKVISEAVNISELKNKLRDLVRTIDEQLHISETLTKIVVHVRRFLHFFGGD